MRALPTPGGGTGAPELALVRWCGDDAPLVLIGPGGSPAQPRCHSTGGLLVRLYTSMYPRAVSGMVLVDAISETIETSLSVTQ
jgi:hypothetical protein